MRQILTYTTPKIPKDGIALLVRDNVVYHTWGDRLYFTKLDEVSRLIESSDIKPTDKLYHFPKNTDIVETLNKGECLNKFLIKATIGDIKSILDEKLKNGAVIGFTTGSGKYHALSSSYSQIYYKNKNSTQEMYLSDWHHPAYKWFEFDNIYELGHWMHT